MQRESPVVSQEINLTCSARGGLHVASFKAMSEHFTDEGMHPRNAPMW